MTGRDKFISALVELYRQGQSSRVIDLLYFCQQSGADYDDIERYAADLKAEKSVHEGPVPHVYRLTDDGYIKYSKKVQAMQAIGTS